MANTLSLDTIREAAERKYGSVDLDLGDGNTVSLKNPLRMTKEERNRFQDVLSKYDVEDEEEQKDSDPIDLFVEAFEVAGGPGTAEKLRNVFGEDAALYASLFEAYTNKGEMEKA